MLASDLGADGDPGPGRDHRRRTVARGIRSLPPLLAFVSFPLLVGGSYDVTPGRQPIPGAVDRLDGPWLAAGFGGHGLMIAPAAGRRLAGAIVGQTPHPSLAQLSPGRFGDEALVQETQIV